MTRAEFEKLKGCEVVDYQPPKAAEKGSVWFALMVLLLAGWVIFCFKNMFVMSYTQRLLMVLVGLIIFFAAMGLSPSPATAQKVTLKIEDDLATTDLLAILSGYEVEQRKDGLWVVTNKKEGCPAEDLI